MSNRRHRPIGIGIQGLADAFILMDIPFHSENAKVVNKKIFEGQTLTRLNILKRIIIKKILSFDVDATNQRHEPDDD